MFVKQKSRVFSTLNVISNFKLFEIHLPAFIVFKTLTDGFQNQKACEFHLSMTMKAQQI